MSQAIPLCRAVLCEDCRTITDSHNSKCERCGSTAVSLLQPMLERKVLVIKERNKMAVFSAIK